MAKELVRCTLRLSGPELSQVREVQDLLSLNTELDATRYLMQRGLEAISAHLGTRRMLRKMESAYSPQEMLPFMEKLLGPIPVQPLEGKPL
jgi:hypothetical protein